jgi:hypothetical protein
LRKPCVLICTLLIFFSINSPTIQAAPILSQECQKQLDDQLDQFTNLIMEDIISSFNLDINQDEDNIRYLKVSFDALQAAHMIYGGNSNDSNYNTLKKHFMGSFRGEPRLFVTAQEAYVLYKLQDNSNIMIHLKLIDSKWKVVERKKKKGNEIKLKPLKCHQEYLKKLKKSR